MSQRQKIKTFTALQNLLFLFHIYNNSLLLTAEMFSSSKLLLKPTIILLFILLLFLGDYKLEFIFRLLKYLPGLHQGEAFYGRVVELQHRKCQGQWKMSRSDCEMSRSNRLWNVKVKQNGKCQGQTEWEMSRSNRMGNVKNKQNVKCQGQTEWEMSRSNRIGNVKAKQNVKCQGQTE